MSENLYTTQTPDSLDNAEDVYTMGTELVFAQNGTISAVRWRSSTNAIATSPFAKVYLASDGTELASKAAGVLTFGNVWNTITFDTPLSVTAGTYYVAAFGPISRYSALSGMHASADLTNGNITAPQNNVGGHKNGRFIASATVAFPTSSGGAGYFVDVNFDVSASNVTLTAAAALGALTATAAISHEVALTGSIGLGGLAAAATIDVGPTLLIPRSGGWQSLLDIIHDARDTREREIAAGPLACPNDGEPLRATPDGGLYCPFDGWRPR